MKWFGMEVQVPGSAVAKVQLYSINLFWSSGRNDLSGTTVRTAAEGEVEPHIRSSSLMRCWGLKN